MRGKIFKSIIAPVRRAPAFSVATDRVRKSATEPIYFAFDRKLKLTSVKVIPVSDIETNKYPHPIWDLVSESNSVPTMDITYGAPIRGMHPAVKGARPDPLQPGVEYRLLIEAGKLKAQDDFVPVAQAP